MDKDADIGFGRSDPSMPHSLPEDNSFPVLWFRRLLMSLQPVYDGPTLWLWFFGLGRIAVLLVVLAGAAKASTFEAGLIALYLVFCAALACSLWHLVILYRERIVNGTLTWAQVVLDFCIISFAISLLSGQSDYYTLLLVIVILESGILLGLIHAFAFAVVSIIFLSLSGLHQQYEVIGWVPYWYNLLIQWIVLICAAFLSGYWNQRLGLMKRFQREILDNMLSGFFVCDLQEKVVLINQSGCAILGLKETEVVGRSVADILVCDLGTECPVVTALHSGHNYIGYEFLCCLADGSTKMLGLTTNPVYDWLGRLTSLIVVFQDLTETVALREAVRQHDRMVAAGASAAEFAHEIRNPLAALRSAVDEMQRSLDAPALPQRLCSIALRESEHLSNIVNRFLEFVRLPDTPQVEVDINALLDKTITSFKQRFSNLEIATDLDPKNPHVLGDETQFRQLCDNILHNAVESIQENGTITVTSRILANHVVLRFDDTGSGIAPDKAMKIFEPFYSEKEKGLGMGLAVCMRIVTAYNGDIRAAAAPGGGLSIIVRLPCRADA